MVGYLPTNSESIPAKCEHNPLKKTRRGLGRESKLRFCSLAADELTVDEQRAVELLRSAGYCVEYWPRRLSAWQVTFGSSEGLGPSLRQALKHCFWVSRALSSAEPGGPCWRARQVGIPVYEA